MTLADASKVLGVSPRQAQRLARDRQITRVAGNVVTAESVARAATIRTDSQLERAWAENTAWAAIAVLSGRADIAKSIGQAQLSRLRNRLKHETAATTVALARNRAKVRRLEGHSAAVRALRELAVTSGTSGQIGELVARNSNRVDGYFTTADADRLQSRYALREALDHANVVMRVTDFDNVSELAASGNVLAAFDLAESGDLRERETGLSLIEEALAKFRQP